MKRCIVVALALAMPACASDGAPTATTRAVVPVTDAISTTTIPTMPTTTIPTATIPATTVPATTVPASTTMETAARPELECGSLATGVHQFDVAGVQRRIDVAAPPDLGAPDGTRQAPVIVLFHGFNSTAEEILATTGLGEFGPANGVVVVAPQGVGSPTGWHIGDASFGDSEFTDRVLELVRASPCVDPARIWLAGFSAGSAWTGVYGCAHSQGVAGLLMHSGLAPPICPADTTPNLMIVHGTADPVVPFGGGAQAVDNASVQLDSVPDSSAGWAARAGCGSPPSTVAAGAHVEILTWSGCAGGRTVSLEAVDGLGHMWSGGADAPEDLNPGCVLVQRLIDAADPVAACL